MNLYNQFIETIQATQDKNLIVDNILKGQKYTTFHFFQYSSSILEISPIATTQQIPSFSQLEIYLPYLKNINDYFKIYPELSLLSNCHPIDNSSCKINIKESLKNLRQNKKTFNSHQLSLSTTPERLEFVNNYYLIKKFLKEKFPQPKNPNFAYIIQINNDQKYSAPNSNPLLQLHTIKREDFKNFKKFDLIFFTNEERFTKEKSELIFQDNSNIDIEKTIEKIDLFNSFKNF